MVLYSQKFHQKLKTESLKFEKLIRNGQKKL